MARSYERGPGDHRPVDDRAGLRSHRRRFVPLRAGRDAGDLHRLGDGRRPALARGHAAAAGSPPSTRCCPASTGRAQGARFEARPPGRALDRDPAADRPLAARRRRSLGARRARDLRRLRRPPGRRRHPLCLDHRRLRRAAAGDPGASRRRRARARPAHRLGGGDQLRRGRRRAALRPRLLRGLERRGRRQRGHDRRRRPGRGPGDRRAHAGVARLARRRSWRSPSRRSTPCATPRWSPAASSRRHEPTAAPGAGDAKRAQASRARRDPRRDRARAAAGRRRAAARDRRDLRRERPDQGPRRPGRHRHGGDRRRFRDRGPGARRPARGALGALRRRGRERRREPGQADRRAPRRATTSRSPTSP